MSIVRSAWIALEDEGRREPGWHVRRIHPTAPCEILAGIRQPDEMPGILLEVRVADVPSGLELPRSNGFSVAPMLLGVGGDARVRFALTLSDRGYATVFSVLCEDVAATAARARTPRAALRDWTTRLHVWQSFMARHGPGGLSEAAVIGLTGELLIIRDELVPVVGVHAALEAWSGPFGEPNDFVLTGGYLEIKTTARQTPAILEIANAAQLDDDRGLILLGHVRLKPNSHGMTLPELVSDVRALVLEHAVERMIDFDNLLMAAGYVEAHADLYMAAFSHERTDFYEVQGEFPRLKRSSIPEGIRDCSYTVEITACAPYMVDRAVLVIMARGEQDIV